MEHFGLAIVEAMAAGCVPLAFRGGGPTEIIRHGETGFLYRGWDQLARLTVAAARDPRRLSAIGRRARISSARFGVAGFRKELRALLKG
jgi:glycosyltransferase involved in cell wall biosynthesis